MIIGLTGGIGSGKTAVSDTFEEGSKWLEINKKYSEIWPNINKKIDPPKDHEKFKNEVNKYEKYFKENLE